MKKGAYYFWFAFLALLWIYTFVMVHSMFQFVIILIILGPVTGRIIYSYLVTVSNEKEYDKKEDIQQNMNQNYVYREDEMKKIYCVHCRKENDVGTKYCVHCGNKVNE